MQLIQIAKETQYLGSKLARFCELKQSDKAHSKTIIHNN